MKDQGRRLLCWCMPTGQAFCPSPCLYSIHPASKLLREARELPSRVLPCCVEGNEAKPQSVSLLLLG